MNRRQSPATDGRHLARLPNVGLDFLKLDNNGRLDPITYFTWKNNIEHSIAAMNFDPYTVLQLLRTKTYLPESVRVTVQHAGSLAALFARIETQTPELGSAVNIAIHRITGLRQCGTDPHDLESRCSELAIAIQDLNKLFPERRLTRSETLVALTSLEQPSPQLLAKVKEWSTLADNNGPHLDLQLLNYLTGIREMYSETRYAVVHLGHSAPGTRSQLNFRKSDADGPKPRKPETSGLPGSDPTPKVSSCHVCEKSHAERWMRCPLLKDVQRQKIQLPAHCCPLCLSRKNPDGKCKKGDGCYLLTSQSGDNYNLLCKVHRKTNFSICTQCPDKSPHIKEQKIGPEGNNN